MKFVGVDLAWSLRRASALCIVRGKENSFQYQDLLYCFSLEEFRSFFSREKESMCLAVDAPLVVKNQSGNRRAEKEVSAFLRKFGSGILPVNQTLIYQKYPRLPLFWSLLRECGFPVRSPLERNFERIAFEVFPPLTLLGLWGEEILSIYHKNKHKKCFNPSIFVRTFGSCAMEGLPLIMGIESFLSAVERNPSLGIDAFDALLCAYTACFVWNRGREQVILFGNQVEGEVVMPIHPFQRDLASLANSRAYA
ncbi:MAG: DUF429 domain-containing protein [Candidatus Caldatribacteriaceae bacterium]